MDFNTKHIVFIILLIIIIIFIFNYDIYIIQKNEELCKPIYITKREISDDFTIKSETYNNMEKFKNLDFYDKSNKNSNKLHDKFYIPNIENKYKKKVLENVLDVLVNIPTNLSNKIIQKLLNHFGNIYQQSLSIDEFYKNVNLSIKKKKYPYKSEFSNFIIFLIDQFDYNNSINNDNNDNNENEDEDNEDDENDDEDEDD
jgi:hypothetical protein